MTAAFFTYIPGTPSFCTAPRQTKKIRLPVVVAKHEDFFSPVGFREVLVVGMGRLHDELGHAAEEIANESGRNDGLQR